MGGAAVAHYQEKAYRKRRGGYVLATTCVIASLGNNTRMQQIVGYCEHDEVFVIYPRKGFGSCSATPNFA